MLMNAPVQPIFISVAAGQGCRNNHYGVNDIGPCMPVCQWPRKHGKHVLEEGVVQPLQLTRTARSALLLMRRQLMNINVGANAMNGR